MTSEPTAILVPREMLILKHYQMDSKEIKCPFKWWVKHEAIFCTIGFLAFQTLRIIGSQIEIEFFFVFSKDTCNV
jgi:hypothetical protein